MRELNNQGIPCFSGSCSEIYLEGAFSPNWQQTERFFIAKELGETSLMFLVDPTLSDSNVSRMGRIAQTIIAEVSDISRGNSDSFAA